MEYSGDSREGYPAAAVPYRASFRVRAAKARERTARAFEPGPLRFGVADRGKIRRGIAGARPPLLL